MNNFSKNINLSNRIYSLLIVFFISLSIAIAQPNATSLPCGVSSGQSLTANGFSGSNPTAATGSCGQCCYAGSDIDGDGDQDVSFSVENSKWYKYCNPSSTTAITIDFIVDETNNDCNLQGAVFVGGTNPNGATDALDIDCSNQEYSEYGSNVGGSADGFSFTGVTIPAGGCAYLMVDGYGGATCGAFTINTVCPPACTVPTTMTAGSDIAICEGTSGALNSTVSGGLTSGSGLVYSWAPSTGLSCTTCADPTANPTSTTTYTLTACNGGTGFCCVTDQVIVNVTPSFVANAGADITSCAPSTVTIGGSPTGPAGSTYTWVVSGTNNAGIAITGSTNVANPTVAISAGATGSETYSVTVVNGACTRTDLVTVTVGTLLVSAGADQSVCAGSTVVIGGAPTAPAGSTYTWTCSGTACANLTLSSSTVANPTVTASSIATGTATYTVSSTLSGCTNTDVVIVTVNALPVTPGATASASPVCAGQSVTLTGTGGVSGSYSWWTAATNGTNLGTANTLVVTPTATTTYYIQTTDATTGCISLRGSVTVTVNATPVASAGSDATLCVGETHTLAGTVANPGACAPVQTWSLISGTGTFSPDANTLNATFTPTSSGTIQIRLTPCTPGSCTAVTDDVILTVAASPSVTVSSTSSTICQGLINDLNGVVTGGTVFPPTITSQSFSSASGPFPFLDNDPNGVVVPISVSGVSNSTLGTTTISAVNVNVDHNRVGQVEVYLCPPGVATTTPYTGCLLMFNNSGANGDDLVNTVFTDASTTDIASGTPPYTGSFNLDGGTTLSGLSGSPTNGTWNLVVLDNNGANPATTGSAGQWGITFETPVPNPPYTYLWTPATGLSVTNDVSTSLFTSGFTPPTSITHTLTVTDANGCTGTGSVTTTIISPPTSTAGSNQTVCGTLASLTGNALTAGHTGAWSVISGSGTFSAGTSNATNVTGLSAGANVFEWTVTNSCGSASSQVTVTANPVPSVTNTITTTTACGSASAALVPTSDVSGATFAWTAVNTGGTITGFTASGSGNISETLTNSGTTAGTVVYTITPSANSCNGTAVTYSVVVNPLPTLSGTAAACVGATSQLTGNGTAHASTPWASTNDAIATVNSTGLVTAVASGSTTITYMNTSGCTASTTFTVNSIPTVSGTLSACVGSTSQLTGSATAHATTPWASSSAVASVNSTGLVTAVSSGTVTITYMNANGCVKSETFTVNGLPTINVSGTNEFCNGGSSTLSVTGASTYTWSPSGSLNTSSGSSVTANPTTSTVYTVNATDVNSCEGSITYSVTVNQNPTAIDFTENDASCGGSDGTVTINGVTGGTPNYQYNFNGLGFSTTTTYGSLASGSYPLIVSDNEGCTFSTTANISSAGGPTAVASTLIADSCGRNTGVITLGAVTGGGGTYEYSVDGSGFTNNLVYSSLGFGSHSIIVRDQFNCSFSTSVIIDTLNGPTGFSSNIINETCGLLNGSIDVTNVNGGTAAYTYSINGINFVSGTTFSGLANGTYTITVRDINTCEYSNQLSVVNIAGPTDVDATDVDATCGTNTGEINLAAVTGGTGPYEFEMDGGGYSALNSFTGLAAGTYTINVRDDNGCVYTEQVTVGNSSGPSAMNTTNINATCGLSNGSITISGVTGGTGTIQYSLDGVTYQLSNSFIDLIGATYTVFVQDGNLCSYSETFTITQTAGPTGVDLTVDDASCGNANGVVTINNVIGGVAIYQYDFDGAGLSTNLVYSSLASGNYSLTVVDGNNCTYTTSIVVGGTLPITGVISTVVNEACSQSNGTITINSVTGGTIGAYLYGINGSALVADNNFTGLAAGTYTVTIQDISGCTYDEPISIGLTSGPTGITPSVIDAGCTVANGSITIDNVAGGTPSYSYGINGGAVSSTSTFSGLASGTYTITVVDGNVCTYTTTVNVNTLNGPTALEVTPINSTCGNANGVVTIGAATNGTAPFEYSFDGSTLSTTTSYTTTAGTHTVIVSDVNLCTYIVTTVVTNTAGPSIGTAVPTDATCGNSNGTLTVSVADGTPNYQYSIDGVNYVSSNVFTGLSSGAPYTVSILDANNCPLVLAPVTIGNSGGPTAAATSQVNTTCGNANGSVTVDPLSVVGGTAPYTYSIDGGALGTSNAFTGLSSSSSHTITVSDVNLCTYTVTVNLTNTAGPTGIDSSIVEVSCGASNGAFTVNNVIGGLAPYTYNLNNQGFGTSTSISNLGIGSYPVAVQDANGCVYNTSVVVIGTGAVDASFTASPTSGILPLTTVFDNNSTIGSIYEWTFGNGASATTYDAQQQYTAAGVYTVTLIVKNGVDPLCNDTATAVITVMGEPTVVVPNIFSPNGDGINDILTIQSSGFKTLDISIFNRWGTLITSYNAIGGNWSGDSNSEGTYFYILTGKRIDDKEFESHGTIMLVK